MLIKIASAISNTQQVGICSVVYTKGNQSWNTTCSQVTQLHQQVFLECSLKTRQPMMVQNFLHRCNNLFRGRIRDIVPRLHLCSKPTDLFSLCAFGTQSPHVLPYNPLPTDGNMLVEGQEASDLLVNKCARRSTRHFTIIRFHEA